jgi:2,3-bisphosphoglycerate-dependent phosphoglycerate mutase
MNLYLVRHGLSTWNVAGRLQGWRDPDLTSEGRGQVAATAALFAALHAQQRLSFAALYSSPLRRAWHTATAIGAQLGLTPQAVPDLREMHGGVVEGLTQAEWQQQYPNLIPAWRDRANLDFGWPEGETRRAFRARCVRVINALMARHDPDAHLIVVTHGGVIKAYLNATRPTDPGGPRPYDADNCSITHLSWPAPGSGDEIRSVSCIRAFNQRDHLGQPGRADGAEGRADLALQ